jgi:quercetin dioxygenase-like cupin family protein
MNNNNLKGAQLNNVRMKKVFLICIVTFAIVFASCNQSNDRVNTSQHTDGENLIFPKGSKIESDHFHGTAWLYWLVRSDSVNHIGSGTVTFEPGARTSWHLHPDGQILIAIGGIGYYQEEGSDKVILKKGDVVTCPPDTPHWHGASKEQEFIQIAVTSRLKGPTKWLQAVSDDEYLAGVK